MVIRVSSVLGICLALSSFTADSAEKILDRTFTVTPGGTLRVRADSGHIVVTGTDSTRVVVHIVATGSQRAVNRMTLAAEQTQHGVAVNARHGSGSWFDWLGAVWRMDSRVTVQVPRHYNVDLNTSGGNLKITGLDGEAYGKTSGGDIRVSDVHGPLRVSTSGGDVSVDGIEGDIVLHTSGGDIAASAIKGGVDVKTSGGGIRLKRIEGATRARTSSGDVVATNVQGEVDLQSSGGDVSAEAIDGKIRARTSGGNISAELVGANRGIVASTSGGSIELRVPKDITALLDASTSGGQVTSELAVATTHARERKLNGTINGGGETIHARTSGGDIRLKASASLQ